MWSGDTVRRMSRLRRPIPIIGFTPEADTRRRMELTWGARSYEVPRVGSTDEKRTPDSRYSSRSVSVNPSTACLLAL